MMGTFDDDIWREEREALEKETAALRAHIDLMTVNRDRDNAQVVSLRAAIRTMHDAIGQGRLGKAQVIAREALEGMEKSYHGEPISPTGDAADADLYASSLFTGVAQYEGPIPAKSGGDLLTSLAGRVEKLEAWSRMLDEHLARGLRTMSAELNSGDE